MAGLEEGGAAIDDEGAAPLRDRSKEEQAVDCILSLHVAVIPTETRIRLQVQMAKPTLSVTARIGSCYSGEAAAAATQFCSLSPSLYALGFNRTTPILLCFPPSTLDPSVLGNFLSPREQRDFSGFSKYSEGCFSMPLKNTNGRNTDVRERASVGGKTALAIKQPPPERVSFRGRGT